MLPYSSLADDFYVNLSLGTEMELSSSRDAVLHFAEQMRKKYPDMRNFYAREKGSFVLEGNKEAGSYRWTAIEPQRLSSGSVNPAEYEQAIEQHHQVLELAPYALSVSPLDCETLDLLVGFDFTYRGNHNQLIVEALGLYPAFEPLRHLPGAAFISQDPNITLALDEECRVQCRVHIEARTTPYHIRTGDFQEDQLSVYVTLRRYGSLEPQQSYADVLRLLDESSRDIIDNYVAPSVLEPLARSIALG